MNHPCYRALFNWPLRTRAMCAAAGAAAALALGPAGPAQASAQAASPGPDSAALTAMARAFVEPSLAAALAQAGAHTLRPEVVMGTLDARLRLAPCARVEAHLPPGTRLWGRSRIGLRCMEGATRWNVFLPVTVKAWGPAWVLRHAVPAGTPLAQDDAEIAEVDWAEHASHVLAAPSLWVGQQAAHALVAGQALRQHMVRAPQAFGAGSQVRVVQSGAGFQVVVMGEALAAGLVGQPTRVRLPGGRVVSGLVRDGQTVELVL